MAPSTSYEHKVRAANLARVPPRVRRKKVFEVKIRGVWDEIVRVYGARKLPAPVYVKIHEGVYTLNGELTVSYSPGASAVAEYMAEVVAPALGIAPLTLVRSVRSSPRRIATWRETRTSYQAALASCLRF